MPAHEFGYDGGVVMKDVNSGSLVLTLDYVSQPWNSV